MHRMLRASFVAVLAVVAACSSSSSSSGGDSGDAGSSDSGGGGGGGSDSGAPDSGARDAGSGDSGSSGSCTVTLTGDVMRTMSCHASAANASGSTTTFGINATDADGYTLEIEINITGDLTVKDYMLADLVSASSTLTRDGGTTSWTQIGGSGANSLGTFTDLNVTDTGPSSTVGSGKEWGAPHGTMSAQATPQVGDGGGPVTISVTF